MRLKLNLCVLVWGACFPNCLFIINVIFNYYFNILLTFIFFSLQIFSLQRYREALAAYWCVDSHENINQISEIILGQTNAYVFFEKNYGDLHTYVRDRRRIKESEAKKLFAQIVSAVQHCHNCGIILRDLKLRKFVFKNEQRWVAFEKKNVCLFN